MVSAFESMRAGLRVPRWVRSGCSCSVTVQPGTPPPLYSAATYRGFLISQRHRKPANQQQQARDSPSPHNRILFSGTLYDSQDSTRRNQAPILTHRLPSRRAITEPVNADPAQLESESNDTPACVDD